MSRLLFFLILALPAWASAQPDVFAAFIIKGDTGRVEYSTTDGARLHVRLKRTGDFWSSDPFTFTLKGNGKLIIRDARNNSKQKLRLELNYQTTNAGAAYTAAGDEAEHLMGIIREADEFQSKSLWDYRLTYRDSRAIALTATEDNRVIYIFGDFAEDVLGDLVWVGDFQIADHIPIYDEGVVSSGGMIKLMHKDHTIHYPSSIVYLIEGENYPVSEILLPDDGNPRPDRLLYKYLNAQTGTVFRYEKDESSDIVAPITRYQLVTTL